MIRFAVASGILYILVPFFPKPPSVQPRQILPEGGPISTIMPATVRNSYGASTVQLLAMELEKKGIKVEIYNYGQPRVGDAKYADFVNTVIEDYWRFTHNRDIVPHVPPTTGFGYLHSCREVFEDENGILNLCSETDCEDSKCANKYSLTQTNTDDHSYYLGRRIDCENSII